MKPSATMPKSGTNSTSMAVSTPVRPPRQRMSAMSHVATEVRNSTLEKNSTCRRAEWRAGFITWTGIALTRQFA